MKQLFVFKLAETFSESCDRCAIKDACDATDRNEEGDEKIIKTFGLKKICSGVEYIVYIPILKLKERRF